MWFISCGWLWYVLENWSFLQMSFYCHFISVSFFTSSRCVSHSSFSGFFFCWWGPSIPCRLEFISHSIGLSNGAKFEAGSNEKQENKVESFWRRDTEKFGDIPHAPLTQGSAPAVAAFFKLEEKFRFNLKRFRKVPPEGLVLIASTQRKSRDLGQSGGRQLQTWTLEGSRGKSWNDSMSRKIWSRMRKGKSDWMTWPANEPPRNVLFREYLKISAASDDTHTPHHPHPHHRQADRNFHFPTRPNGAVLLFIFSDFSSLTNSFWFFF